MQNKKPRWLPACFSFLKIIVRELNLTNQYECSESLVMELQYIAPHTLKNEVQILQGFYFAWAPMNKSSFISIASARLLFVAPFSAINWQQSALFYTSFCTGALFLFLQDHSPAIAGVADTNKEGSPNAHHAEGRYRHRKGRNRIGNFNVLWLEK